MAKQQPFLPLFFGDFLASTAEWEGEEASLYLTLLGHQWSVGSLPADLGKLCRLARWDRKLFDRCWPQVSTKFVSNGDRLTNPRLEQHRVRSAEISKKNSASGKKGAESKWHKDGERHGERHSERHSDATGEALASAMKAPVAARQRNNDGVTDGNPSHPIPSQPSEEAYQGKKPEKGLQ